MIFVLCRLVIIVVIETWFISLQSSSNKKQLGCMFCAAKVITCFPKLNQETVYNMFV